MFDSMNLSRRAVLILQFFTIRFSLWRLVPLISEGFDCRKTFASMSVLDLLVFWKESEVNLERLDSLSPCA